MRQCNFPGLPSMSHSVALCFPVGEDTLTAAGQHGLMVCFVVVLCLLTVRLQSLAERCRCWLVLGYLAQDRLSWPGNLRGTRDSSWTPDSHFYLLLSSPVIPLETSLLQNIWSSFGSFPGFLWGFYRVCSSRHQRGPSGFLW